MIDLNWLRARDAGLSALRRAARTAIVMPSMFAIGTKVLGNPTLATFAAFGSFAMLLLVDFGGSRRERLAAQLSLVAVGAVFVCLGTLASNSLWLAAVAMAVVGFVVLFAGVVSSVLAGATTSLLLGFILPVTLPGPVGSIPDRLFGWLLAGAVSLVAITLLWPTPASDPLRSSAAEACRSLAAQLAAEVRFVLAGRLDATELDAAVAAADAAVTAMRNGFFATPYRPTGLTSAARTVVRLVDEVVWLSVILDQPSPGRHQHPVDPSVCAVKAAAAAVLEHSANLLVAPGRSTTHRLDEELTRLRQALKKLENNVTDELPVHRAAVIDESHTVQTASNDATVAEFVSSLEPSFRAQEMSFAISAIADNIALTAAAQQRSWTEQLLGHQPAGVAGPLASAYERAGAHAERHSVWLHNSLRGAAALGVAVAIAELTGVQHSFWVVLGTLSVLRSNALSTGQNVLRGLLGTVAGFVIGAALVLAIGTNTVAFWCLLPPAILFAGLAPAVISFAAGQAGFTVTLLILFNIIVPSGWQVGLVRIEDIAIGCAVSLVVGALFWPRGAGSALGQTLAEAYTESAQYLRQAVTFGMLRCDRQDSIALPPQAESQRAAAAARRLDDAFRNFLAERGSKRLPLTAVATLITGVAGLRLTADAVLELWTGQDGSPTGDRTAARNELLAGLDSVAGWYESMASALTGGGQVPEPLPHDQLADSRLIEAVRRDLSGEHGRATATAVRMIWTGDHLDAARRLQLSLSEPARVAATRRPRYQPLRHLPVTAHG
jgi:hypothetical protein